MRIWMGEQTDRWTMGMWVGSFTCIIHVHHTRTWPSETAHPVVIHPEPLEPEQHPRYRGEDGAEASLVAISLLGPGSQALS